MDPGHQGGRAGQLIRRRVRSPGRGDLLRMWRNATFQDDSTAPRRNQGVRDVLSHVPGGRKAAVGGMGAAMVRAGR